MSIDLSKTIQPKTDQLNADSLIAGPITITVTKVSLLAGDQPVAVHYQGDDGKPYKPSKGMRRIMVMLWGNDGAAYVGRSMTLYRDEKVRFGGVDVGGIRIAEMSHISAPVTVALTVSKAVRKPYTVKPLAMQAARTEQRQDEPIEYITVDQVTVLTDILAGREDVAAEFLKKAGCESLETMRASVYKKAKDWLEAQND